ncbi:MAG: prolipoprotein diacylglyceryl transferase [Bacteroidales bacterium]|nr:prolipoprotein diacylglyceryl transferase [Bacteroidales bacterium]
MIAFITWEVSPQIFSIGSFEVRWYGLMFAFSFYFGYLIVRNMFRKEGIAENKLDSLATWVIIATIIGARLGHTLFYQPEHYLRHPLDILKIWEGGLASHGAAISIVLALWWFVRKEKWDFLWLMDRIVIAVALAGFFIRMGNLFNSEIYGKPTDLPWGFVFTSVDDIPRHPTQLYEALSYLSIFLILLWYYRKSDGKPKRGIIFGWFLILIFGARILIEFLKEPQVMFEQTMALNMGQWLSIPLVIAGIAVLIWTGRNRKT